MGSARVCLAGTPSGARFQAREPPPETHGHSRKRTRAFLRAFNSCVRWPPSHRPPASRSWAAERWPSGATSAPPSASRRCWRRGIFRILRIGALRHLRLEFRVLRLERVGDVLEEDQAQDDELVLRCVHVVAERVGGSPELGFEAEVGGRVVGPGGPLGMGLQNLEENVFAAGPDDVPTLAAGDASTRSRENDLSNGRTRDRQAHFFTVRAAWRRAALFGPEPTPASSIPRVSAPCFRIADRRVRATSGFSPKSRRISS